MKSDLEGRVNKLKRKCDIGDHGRVDSMERNIVVHSTLKVMHASIQDDSISLSVFP
jgi:hypothetical protein